MSLPASFPHALLTRRRALSGLAIGTVLVLAGCSSSAREGRSEARRDEPGNAAAAAGPGLAMMVHRDPSCGCCEAWAEVAAKAGYRVTVRDDPDMPGVKRRLGVPQALASCHTAEVGGLVVEGHVPMEHVARLLRDRPAGVVGIAVPGMPLGSPGMEVPDGARQPFEVLAFDGQGKVAPFGA